MSAKRIQIITAALLTAGISTTATSVQAAGCYNANWNPYTQRCEPKAFTPNHAYQQPTYQHGETVKQGDAAEGLLLLGGLLVGGAILHSIFDKDDKPAVHAPVTPTPPVQNVHHTSPKPYPHHGDKRRKRALKRTQHVCGAVANNHAQNGGYTNATISEVTKLKQRGDRHWVLSGKLALQRQHHKRSRHRQWTYDPRYGWTSGWATGWNDQPQFVTKTETRRFKCSVKNGEVVRFGTWLD